MGFPREPSILFHTPSSLHIHHPLSSNPSPAVGGIVESSRACSPIGSEVGTSAHRECGNGWKTLVVCIIMVVPRCRQRGTKRKLRGARDLEERTSGLRTPPWCGKPVAEPIRLAIRSKEVMTPSSQWVGRRCGQNIRSLSGPLCVAILAHFVDAEKGDTLGLLRTPFRHRDPSLVFYRLCRETAKYGVLGRKTNTIGEADCEGTWDLCTFVPRG